MVKVSIIIPVYNGEKYVSEAIDSVLNQTYKDLEIIEKNILYLILKKLLKKTS